MDDAFLCRDPTCLGALKWEDLTDNVSAFVKPKNDVKCSFIIDMRNLNDCSKVPLRKVRLPSIHTVFQTIQREIHRGAPLWGITLDISNFYWSLQIPAEHRGLFRKQGAHFHCLPFGWNFSPVLAQDTLAALLKEVFDNHAEGLDIYRFHYLDDVLILSRDRECMKSLDHRLACFLTAKGLPRATSECPVAGEDVRPGQRGGAEHRQNAHKVLGDCHKNGLLACVSKGGGTGHGKNAMGIWTTKRGHPVSAGVAQVPLGTSSVSAPPEPGPDIGTVRCAGDIVRASHG